MIFFNQNIYYYDMNSAYLNILRYMNIDVSNEEKIKDKKTRVIEITKKIQKLNLFEKVLDTLSNIIEKFKEVNDIDKPILIARDGIITTKKCNILSRFYENKYYISFKEQYKFNFFIITHNNKWIGVNQDDEYCIIKGVRNKSIGLDEFIYKNITPVPIDTRTTRLYFHKIKKKIINKNTPINVYTFKVNDMYSVYMKDIGIVNVKDMKLINKESIDSLFYYNLYIKDFIFEICQYF